MSWSTVSKASLNIPQDSNHWFMFVMFIINTFMNFLGEDTKSLLKTFMCAGRERHLLSPLQEKSRLSSSHKQLVTWWKLFLWWAWDGQHWESCCCSTRYRCDLFSDVVLFLESLLFKLKRNKQETWYLLDDHISLYYSAINPVNIMHYLLLIISKYFYISKYFLFSRCRRCAKFESSPEIKKICKQAGVGVQVSNS